MWGSDVGEQTDVTNRSIHSSIYPFIQTFIHTYTYLFIHLSTYFSIYLTTHPSIHLPNSVTHVIHQPGIHSITHTFIQPLMHSFNYSCIHSTTHAFIQPLIHTSSFSSTYLATIHNLFFQLPICLSISLTGNCVPIYLLTNPLINSFISPTHQNTDFS